MNQGSIAKKALSVLLAGSLLLGEVASMTTLPVYADDGKNTDGKAKYISDVFIAYGRTEKDAKDWLLANKL